MTNDHQNYNDDWTLHCFLVLANNSLLFPTASLNIFKADYVSVGHLFSNAVNQEQGNTIVKY
jgi:hypothetical protein